MLQLQDPVGFLTGATPSVRRAWAALGIETIQDLLTTAPRRYDDYSRSVAIKDVQEGEVATVRGKVVKAWILPTFRRRLRLVRVTIEDKTGVLGATFFHQPWLLEKMQPGLELFFSGKIRVHPRFGKSMTSPIWEPATGETLAAGKIAPVYPLSGSLSQKKYRELVQQALVQLSTAEDPLPEDIRKRYNLATFAEALKLVHAPGTMADAERGRERLAFDELLSYQLILGKTRKKSETKGAPGIAFDEPFAKRFVTGLPFALTDDQRRAAWTAMKEMGQEKPMRRLLQGDVGSGKTIVAAFLAAQTARAGYSAALLAPTDILARQHAQTLSRLLTPYGISLLLFTRTERFLWEEKKQQKLEKETAEERVRQGNLVLVGTHALLEADRLPHDLAFAVVDEQHRFGVAQREALISNARKDGLVPHLLSMTATPIPRSLLLTLYGDLDVSMLKEKPAGRIPIHTQVFVGENREQAYKAIREAIERGEQAFITCPLIDPSDTLGVRSVTEEWQRLSESTLKGLRMGLLHGRLKTVEKDTVMKDFAEGNLDVLVATTVIEVGIDIPKATVMAIDGAERFGLAQLHQLRGRVGRSTLPSSCFLLTDVQGDALKRLEMVAQTQDGFRLAEEDLKIRGGGDMLGTMQSGQAVFRSALATDLSLMAAAREEAKRMLDQDASLETFPHWAEQTKQLQATSHLE
jgi:ATP-dependent DNA helicase RecG